MDLQSQLQTVVKDLGMEGLAPEKQEELIVKIGEALLNLILLETMERLDDAGREEFQKIVDEKSTAKRT